MIPHIPDGRFAISLSDGELCSHLDHPAHSLNRDNVSGGRWEIEVPSAPHLQLPGQTG